MKSVTLRINGMHCAACVTRLERVLRRVPGVEEAHVDFATNEATIQAPAQVTPEQLVAAVERAGYGARVPRAAALAEADAEEAAAQRGRWRDAALALSVAVPAVAMMIPGLVPHGWMWGFEAGLVVASVPVMAWSGRGFYRRAAIRLPRGEFDMDTLVALGTGAAFTHAVLALAGAEWLARGDHGTYIDAVPVVIGMVLLGQAIEGRARRATGQALRALLDLAPSEAIRLDADGERVVRVAELRPGDRVVVKPGARVPVDGTVTRGVSAVDRSMMTGEPIPVTVHPGDSVTGGTVNGAGLLEVRVVAVGDDAVLARIVGLVERARMSRPPVADLVDRIAAVFVPVVLGVAAVAGLGWTLLGAPAEGARAVLATLVVACPCAMGLATPISLVLGLGNAARAGVLLRHGRALQALAEVDTVVFDKTGTLTVGRPVVRSIEVEGVYSEAEVLRLAAAADRASNHPLAEALVRAAAADALPEATELTVVPGAGVSAVVDGHRVRVGSPRWLGGAADAPGTPIVVEIDGARAGVLRVDDPARPGARSAVQALRARGLEVHLLTGDAEGPARRIAEELGVAHWRAGVLPEGKIEMIRALAARGRRVAMVGDGVNDAPALAAAHVGIAMGTGTDVAMEAADVTLHRADPAAVVDAVDIARATLRNVRQNLFLAFAYNICAIPIAALGLLSPAIAGAAMALSSVTVVWNARRLAVRSSSARAHLDVSRGSR